MSTFGRYLTYRLKNSVLRTLIFTLLSVIYTLSSVSISIDYEAVEMRTTGIAVLATLLGILCTVMPMLETSGFKNRRNLDTLYFFPITRQKMAVVHYLSGFIQACAIYTVTFITSFVYLLVKTDCFALGYMIGYYFASLALGFVIYSVVIFIFGQANSETDGVVFTVMWMFAISLAVFAAHTFVGELLGNYQSLPCRIMYPVANWGILYAPINNLTVIFQKLIEVHHWRSENVAAGYASQWYMFVVWGVIGIAAVPGYVCTFTKKGAQRVGEISDSPFGYRLLIPLYGYSLMFIIGTIDVLVLPVLGIMIIGYIVYRRSVKLKARDLIVTACGIIPLILSLLLLS